MDSLTNAVRDAYVLLRHACERGIAVKPEDAETISAMRGCAEPSSAQEAKFWAAYATVAKAAQPVTVASLQATDPSTADGARRTVGRYIVRAVSMLVILAALQTFTAFGARSLLELKTIGPRMQDNRFKIKQLSLAMSAPHAGTKAPTSAEDQDKFSRLQDEMREDAQRFRASQDTLLAWRNFWHLERTPEAIATLVYGAPRAVDAAEGATPAARSASASSGAEQHYKALLEAEVVLSTLQDYLLPFLYGLLGTCVFILRNLTSAVREQSYTSDVTYKLRMPLGGLAGVAITLLPAVLSSTPKLAGVTPFALAFIAGYSVELLFTAMDRFVGAFAGDPAPPRAAGAPS